MKLFENSRNFNNNFIHQPVSIVSIVLIKKSQLYNINFSFRILHVPLYKIEKPTILKATQRFQLIFLSVLFDSACWLVLSSPRSGVISPMMSPPYEMKLTISLVDRWTRSHFRGTLLSNTYFCFLHDIPGFCFSSRRLADNRTMTADDNYQTDTTTRTSSGGRGQGG